MENNLTSFVKRIDQFEKLCLTDKIDLFSYYFGVTLNQDYFFAAQINNAFSDLRLVPYSNIPQYLKDNSNKAAKRKKTVKYIKTKIGYHLESSFQKMLELKIKAIEEELFINYSINPDTLDWKPSDIPLINKNIIKNAEFFTRLYYLLYQLENSIRIFLKNRLASINGNDWEKKLIQRVDLTKAQSIRNEVNISATLPNRGENILYYCLWDDYGKIIKEFSAIINDTKDRDEIIAHLNTIAKIRNAIAHNAATIPSEYQIELTLFVTKYIKIIKKHSPANFAKAS